MSMRNFIKLLAPSDIELSNATVGELMAAWVLSLLHRVRVFARRRPLVHRVLRFIARPLRPIFRRVYNSENQSSYRAWSTRHDTLRDSDLAAIRAHIAALPFHPLISIVMPAFDTPAPLLREAIASVRRQAWPNWELCVVDDASPSPRVARLLRRAAAKEPRIRWARRETNGHICVATNDALAMAKGEWVALMDHDDILPEHALYEVALEIIAHPEARVIYSDEDKLDAKGVRFGPYFKPDFDPDLLLGENFISHLGVYRRDVMQRLGGLREGFEGAQDYDLALRATAGLKPEQVRHIPAILYHWRVSAEQESFSQSSLERCAEAARRAIRDYLAQSGLSGDVTPAPAVPRFNRVIWPVPEAAPLVSIIIPTRDRADLLERCLEGLLHRTDYPAIEILIADNGSIEPETHALFARHADTPNLRVLSMPGPFNYSLLNNRAAAAAAGEILLFLNNDIDVIEPGWLREMVSHAVRPDIGAVGAKLIYANETIQHAGVILGIGWPGGVAGHYFCYIDRKAIGPFGLLSVVRSASAVTGACMAMRKSVFFEAGQFETENLTVAFNDVDLCLRIRESGYRNLWTPFAELYHLESASRGYDLTSAKARRFSGEVAYMRRRWGDILDHDPYWNPNLALTTSEQRELAPIPRRVKPWHAFSPGKAALTPSSRKGPETGPRKIISAGASFETGK